MKILNFGSCNIDYVYSVGHFVNAGETISAGGMEVFPGGKGLNQSIALARAGAKVCHAGYIGNDGGMLRDILLKSGADVSCLKQVDAKNGHAVIQVDKNGENSIIVYKGTNGIISKEFIDEVLDKFSGDDVLLIQNETNNIAYLVEQAYKKNMKIVFNPSPFKDELKKIDLNHISYLILNETEAKGFSGKDNPDEFIKYMTKAYPGLKIVLTLGKKGCIYADREEVLTHPAFEVRTVDTTAAGDTFTGYFVSQILLNKSSLHAVKIASAASAIAVSKPGAASSIPDMHEVERVIKNLKPYSIASKSKKEIQRSIIYDYIEQNLQNACLEGLAGSMGYSDAYVGARVKEVMGESFSQILQNKRCGEAAKMLRETDLSVSDIINKIGYENESFFRKIFKEIYGKSPLEYRKNNER